MSASTNPTVRIRADWPPGSNAALLARQAERKRWINSAPAPAPQEPAPPLPPAEGRAAYLNSGCTQIEWVMRCVLEAAATGKPLRAAHLIAQDLGIDTRRGKIGSIYRELQVKRRIATRSDVTGRRVVRVLASGQVVRTADCPADWGV